jgi:P27 family predicted phage terminase small subunit
MGQRGPAPTPTKVLEMRGSWRAGEREGEPKPEAKVPDCPDWLSDDGKAEWFRVATLLNAIGLIAEMYLMPLALYCSAVSDFKQYQKIIEEEGATFTTEKGYVGQHPAVAMRNNAWDRVLKAAKEFGMTPSAISSTKANKKETNDGKGKKFFRAG